MRRFVWLLFIPVILCADWPWKEQWGCCGEQWSPTLVTLGRAGNYRKGGGALVFSPISSSCGSILFGQAHGGIFRDLYAGSVGLGYRRQAEPTLYSRGHYFAWGVNAFFDIARSNSQRVYYQGSLGGEILGECWLFRVNGYFPSRNRHVLSTRMESNVFVNGTAIISTDSFFDNVEQGYHGFDVELGKGVQVGCGQLWGYAGYYHFDATKAKLQSGPRLRLEYTLDQALAWCPLELTAGGEWEHNQRHGSTVSGYVSMRLPLYTGCNTRRSSSCCDGICRLMGDPVFRNRAIWVDREERENGWPITRQVGNIFFAEAGGTGGGSQSAPDDLAGAFASATAPGDVIFLLADSGDLVTAATHDLAANQQLVSFGTQGRADIDLGSGRMLTVTPLSGASGTAATVASTGAPAFTFSGAGSDHLFQGMVLTGPATGIVAAAGTPGANLSCVDCGLVTTNTAIAGSTPDPINDLLLERSNLTGHIGATMFVPRQRSFQMLHTSILPTVFTSTVALNTSGLMVLTMRDVDLSINTGTEGISYDGASAQALVSQSRFVGIGASQDNAIDRGGGPAAFARERFAILGNEFGATGGDFTVAPVFSQSNFSNGNISSKWAIVGNLMAESLLASDSVRIADFDSFAPSRTDILVSDNTLIRVRVDSGISGGSGPVSATVRNNRNSSIPTTALLNSDASGTAPICATLDGNTFGVTVTQSGGPITVTNFASYGPLNNGTAPTGDTPTNSVIPCPLP